MIELKKHRDTYSHHFIKLEQEEHIILEKGKTSMSYLGALFPGTTARVRLISESGLYKLIMRSDKPHLRDVSND